MTRRVVICGAGGRDFFDFARVFRDDPSTTVVAFTATQIPGIDDRRYPAELAGPSAPDGIPIVPEARLEELIASERVDEVVLSYSDLAHTDVMHLASRALAAGADFRLLGPRSTMLRSSIPVVAVTAVRTGCGKSQIARAVGRLLRDRGLRVALVRHPMPYGDLLDMRVQRFATIAEIDESSPTVEEREEYEPAVDAGFVMFAGVDYEAILAAAEAEADVIVWDGGNNDTSFYEPSLTIVVVDALRPGHELAYHPGETNLRLADVVVVNKVDAADAGAVDTVLADVAATNPGATVITAASPVVLDDGPDLAGEHVLVVEDGPTITHGGMAAGAGLAAALAAGAIPVDPRPYAVGSVAATYERFPHIGPVLPAMGYGEAQLGDLAATVRATPCDTVVVGTPADLSRLVDLGRPTRRARYDHRDAGAISLGDALAPFLDRIVPRR